MGIKDNKLCTSCMYDSRPFSDEPCSSCYCYSNWTDSYRLSALDTQIGGGHYKDMKIQPIKFIVENNIPFREANAIKYICRHRSKNGKQDIEKAIHYLQMILESYEEEES